MKNVFSNIAAIVVYTLFVCILSETAPAQNTESALNRTKINQGSEKYGKLKNLSLTYLNEELPKNNNQSADDYKILSMNKDGLGFVHTKIQQIYKGVPVFGGEAIVHLNKDDSLSTITDDFVHLLADDVSEFDVKPVLNANEAVRRAFEIEGCSKCTILEGTKPEMMIYADKKYAEDSKTTASDRAKLIYKIQLDESEIDFKNNISKMPVYFIDAKTGDLVFSYNNLQTQSAANSGSSLYSGNVSFTATPLRFFNFNFFVLENLNLRIGTFNGNTSSFFFDNNGLWDDSIQRAAVDAHWGAEKTLEFYRQFGRNGIDGNGGPLSIRSFTGTTDLLPIIVHNKNLSDGCPYNAGWRGTSAKFCDGDDVYFSPLVSLDIVGHELTHGVTQFSAGLLYARESGALNEAVSDIFGSMIERSQKGESTNTWTIGEDFFTPNTPGDALRYMDNPRRNNQPDFYADRDFPGDCTPSGTNDNCGVHTNSAIPNHEFYLLSQGGHHRRGESMTGIGADKATNIWYYALTNLMTSSTNFAGARTATLNAANMLYGPVEANAVARSWCLVGVGTCVKLNYQAHVQDFGWMSFVSDGQIAGTTGLGKRMEAVQILWDNAPAGSDVQYRAHISGFGWMPWVNAGATAGTTWQSIQMEAVELRLVNAPVNCNVTYRAHVAYSGWLPWVSDGQTAGTTGQGTQMEALQAVVNCR
jgi:Zn-dependent metalloprotease